MSEKTIHIVFQVLNFLTSPAVTQFKLLPIDKIILILLAKHHGKRGIFPNQETLSTEAQISVRHIRERTKYLIEIGLISVKRVSRKYHYYLDFLSTTPEPQFPYNELIAEPQFRSYRNHSSGHSGTVVPTNNKEEELMNKTERRRKPRATPLSDDFLITDETIRKAQDLGLTEDEANEELDKFFAHYQGTGQEMKDWNKVLQRWFMRAMEYKRNERGTKRTNGHDPNEIRSTVPWYKPDPMQSVGNIIREGLNGVGRKGKN